MKMGGLRSIISGTCRARTVLTNVHAPLRIQKYGAHMEGPPQPFDNLPFSVPNRLVNNTATSIPYHGLSLSL